MPSDLSVSAVTIVSPSRVPEESLAAAGSRLQASPRLAPVPQIDHPNPTFSIAPSLGIVVIQFRNQGGEVSLSIPSQRQLDAYEADPFSAHQGDSDAIVA